MYLQGIVLISSKLYRSLNIPSSSESVMGNQTFEPGFIMPDRLAEKKISEESEDLVEPERSCRNPQSVCF